jgi:hypothetical protein
VQVDERVVAEDGPVVGGDEPHAAHVRGQGVDLVDADGGLQALVPAPQIAGLELVGIDLGVLGQLVVDGPDPVAPLLQVGDQVMADETTSTGDEHAHASMIAHRRIPP